MFSIVQVSAAVTAPRVLSPEVSVFRFNKSSQSNQSKVEEIELEYIPSHHTQDARIYQLLNIPHHNEIEAWWNVITNKSLYSECEKRYIHDQKEYIKNPNNQTFVVVQNIALKIIPYWMSANEMKSMIQTSLLFNVSKGHLQDGEKNLPLIIFLTTEYFLNQGINKDMKQFQPTDWDTYLLDFPTCPTWLKENHGKYLYAREHNNTYAYDVSLDDMVEVVAHNIGNFLYKPAKANLTYTQINMLVLMAFLKWSKGNPPTILDRTISNPKKNLKIASKMVEAYKFLVVPPFLCEVRQKNLVDRYAKNHIFHYSRLVPILTIEYVTKRQNITTENSWVQLTEPLSLKTIAWSTFYKGVNPIENE